MKKAEIGLKVADKAYAVAKFTSGLSTGAIVGIIVGTVLLIILVVVILKVVKVFEGGETEGRDLFKTYKRRGAKYDVKETIV